MRCNDGGPAFPVTCDFTTTDGGGGHTGPGQKGVGMSLRDWFAGQAAVALIREHYDRSALHEIGVAENAYIYADAMLKEREK